MANVGRDWPDREVCLHVGLIRESVREPAAAQTLGLLEGDRLLLGTRRPNGAALGEDRGATGP